VKLAMAVGVHQPQIGAVVRAAMCLGQHMMPVQVLAGFEPLLPDGTETLRPTGELPRAIR
jgi:hypothetical protein